MQVDFNNYLCSINKPVTKTNELTLAMSQVSIQSHEVYRNLKYVRLYILLALRVGYR